MKQRVQHGSCDQVHLTNITIQRRKKEDDANKVERRSRRVVEEQQTMKFALESEVAVEGEEQEGVKKTQCE